MFSLVQLSYGYIDCPPNACDSSFTDSGVVCLGGECVRTCVTNICNETWSEVFSDTFGFNNNFDEDRATSATNPTTDTNKCYKFTYIGSSDNNDVVLSVDPNPPTDCDGQALGGFYGNWFSGMTGYISGQISSDVNNILQVARASSETGANSDSYLNGMAVSRSISCAPNVYACSSMQEISDCDIDCYGQNTQAKVVQGYYKDKGSNDASLYSGSGCGNSYVNDNKLRNIQFKIYESPTLSVNGDKACERTNEAPTATNVKILPSIPTAGDDLICDYTYSDPEGFEEKNSTYAWYKNGANQNINSRILDKSKTSPGQSWYCKITPSDGLIFGTTKQSNTVTIASTVSNAKLYVDNVQVWNRNSYYSGTDEVLSFEDELQLALDNCVADANGYCDIEIKADSSASGTLKLDNLEIYISKKPLGFGGLPDKDTDEDVTPGWQIDLWSYVYDAVLTGADLNYSLSQSNSSLISCSISSGRYLSCNKPAADQYGSSDITVTATDSIDSTDGKFTVTVNSVNDKPVPVTYSPAEGSVFVTGTSVLFNGSAADVEDGIIQGSKLEWSSDKDGTIGTGETATTSSLSLGQHIITFKATDNDGESNYTFLSIIITPPCVENWVQTANDCETNDKRLTEYTDSSSCGTVYLLPADNGTYADCNYCTPSWQNINSSCMKNDIFNVTYAYTNTCCADTNLESDCIIPLDTTDNCDYCLPSWQEQMAGCRTNNTDLGYYIDGNNCYAITGLPSDNNKPGDNTYICDYCTPEWQNINSSCMKNDIFNITYTYTNSCCSDTQLESDCIIPIDTTDNCDYCLPSWQEINESCQPNNKLNAYYTDSNSCYSKTSLESDNNVPANNTYDCIYNTIPTLSISDYSVNEDTQPPANWIDLWNYGFDLEDGAAGLNYSIVSQSNTALISCSITASQFINCNKPSLNQFGSSDILARAADSKGATAESTFKVIVNPVNDIPVSSIISPADNSVFLVGAQVMFTGTATDVEDSSLAPAWLSSIDGALSSLFSFTTNLLSIGRHIISFTAADSEGGTDTKALNSIVISRCLQNTDCGTDAYLGTNYCKDRNVVRDLNSYLCLSPGTVTAACTSITSPSLQESCSYGCSNAVCMPNSAPVITSSPVTAATQGVLYVYNVTVSDPDNHTPQYSFSDKPVGMSINNDGIITWLPTNDDAMAGTRRVELFAEDGHGGIATQIFTITVANVNDAPVILPGDITGIATEKMAYTHQFYASDPDMDSVVFSLVNGKATMSITSAGFFLWTPGNDETGAQDITVRADDGNGGSALFTFTVIVENVNDAPLMGPIPPISAKEGDLISVKPVVSDPDNDIITFSYSDKFDNTGYWQTTYHDAGVYDITVTADDGNGGTASDSVFIAINSVSVPDFTVPFLFKQRQNGLEAIYTFMIKNIGEKAPDEIPWRLDAGDGIVKTGVIKDKKLNVGESMTVAEKVIYKAPGGKTVIVLVNPDGTEPELESTNNGRIIDVNI